MDRSTLPFPARVLGPAGLIPFATFAAGVWAGWPSAPAALAAYGAVILSFIGAVHWGIALKAPAQERSADWYRFGLGALAAFVAWLALLLPLSFGLGLLAVGILASAAVERKAWREGLLQEEYHWLRLLLSAGAAGFLVAGLAGL